MTEAIVKTKKIGGSIMVTIPKNIAEMEQISPNEIIRIELHKIKHKGFGILKHIKDKKTLKILHEKTKISDYD